MTAADELRQVVCRECQHRAGEHYGFDCCGGGGCCPCDLDFAEVLAENGVVGAETFEALDCKLSHLLFRLTDGRMSKTGYDVDAMVREVESVFEGYAQEDIANAWDEGAANAADREDAAFGENPYRIGGDACSA